MIAIAKKGLSAWITTKLRRTSCNSFYSDSIDSIGMISFTVLKKSLPTKAPPSRDWAVRKKYLENEEVFFTCYGQSSGSLGDALY